MAPVAINPESSNYRFSIAEFKNPETILTITHDFRFLDGDGNDITHDPLRLAVALRRAADILEETAQRDEA